MSKGSRPRPFSVSQNQFGANFDAIFRKPDPRVVEDAQAEDEAFDIIEQHQKDALNAYNDERLVSKMDKQQLKDK
jgi:hypothetical protein